MAGLCVFGWGDGRGGWSGGEVFGLVWGRGGGADGMGWCEWTVWLGVSEWQGADVSAWLGLV